MKTPALAFLVVCVGLGTAAPAPAGKKDRNRLQGTWQAVTVEDGGPEKDAADIRFVFAGDDFTIRLRGEAIAKGRFKIDPSRDPRQIDMELTKHRQADFKGKTVRGIYALDGDTLKLCLNSPDKAERPKEFNSPAGQDRAFITLKRVKP
jgi:uncharacterized protein (TIGR03067 family)